MSRNEGGDLTRTRIRDAAIARFADEGFGVGLRAIAADASVTAGLITHHYGSKAALRRDCDEHVLRILRVWKPRDMAGHAMIALLDPDEVEHVTRLLFYLVRSLQSGGALARSFLGHLVADARESIENGVAAGLIDPSPDEAARARTLIMDGVGALLLEFTLDPPTNCPEVLRFIRTFHDRSCPPGLATYRERMPTDPSVSGRLLADRPVVASA
ncbi:MAG: TetR family transcriptional regulator [Actinomycetales bacterium]|nr:TetR family transcriptional regulator [Actinomycetales bacterium]